MAYAEKTKVPIEQSKKEIEQTLARYGADRFAYFTEANRAMIVFEAHNRRLRFDLPLSSGQSDKEKQDDRRKWRALVLCIKAKLESAPFGALRLSNESPIAVPLTPAHVGDHVKLLEGAHNDLELECLAIFATLPE